METRELFWGLGSAGELAFYLIGLGAVVAFLWGFIRPILKYRRGRPSPVKLDLWQGIRRMLADVVTHRTLYRRDAYAGIAHMGIFFGFALLFIGTAIVTLEYDILKPLFGITFWKGTFFLVFSLILDLAGLAVLLGIALMAARRAAFGLPKLNYSRDYQGESTLRPAAKRWQLEDWVFLVALAIIIVTGFIQEGSRHALEQPVWGWWEPIGALFGKAFLFFGVTADGMARLRAINWWFHGLAALTFIVALPWYKAKHILAAMASLAGRDPLALKRLPKPEPEAQRVGVGAIADFSWKDMVDFDACTKCGRCHEACPARIAGYPLSPRDLILDLRLHNDRMQGRNVTEQALIGDIINPETLWSCRTCGACLEICPVGVEHPVKIVQMRRQLIEQDGIDPLLKTMLNTISTSGNSFGEPGRKRAAWTRELEFKIKDVRQESANYLWFVGDQASFDPRNQKVSRTVARIFKAARIDFGLLHEGEKTAGNDVRRVGEEGLFESLAEHNLAQMAQARAFRQIVTTDPHSYNTLRNEYPDFGEIPAVVHYTELLRDLLASGALKVRQPLGLKVTFHDPCHLGRLNKQYDAPRQVLELIGCQLVEMPRNRDNSFCCGAGGGRIWIPDRPGAKKPSEIRVREAAALGAIDVFVTCCPKDLTMFEDARKTAGFEKDFVVEDIAELVARAIQLDEIQLQDLPSLTEKITQAIAEKVANAVGDRLEAIIARLPVSGPASLPQAVAPVAITSSPVAVSVAGGIPASGQAAPSGVWRVTPVTPGELPAYDIPPKAGVRILVPVKQVAKLGDEFSFSDDQKHIPAEYFECQMNEWDDTALEQALQIIEARGGGEVVVVTVGGEESEESLRKALAKGANRAVRVWDESLVDADPITVARMLAGVAQQEKPDLIIAGAQSADLANGATGTALGRILGLPCAALIVGTEWDGGNAMTVTRELEGGLQHKVRMPVPAVVTMQTGANTPRYATMRMVKQARDKPLAVVAAGGQAMSRQAAVIGSLAVPPATRAEMLTGSSADVAAAILKIIREKTGGA